ncbi:MAG: hypothetical protein M3Q81_01430 [bacterium]|nr:hypothetical protein [bacterium]
MKKPVLHNTRALLLILFFATYVLGQLQRIQVTPQIAFYVHDLVLFLYLVTTIATYQKQLHKALKNKMKLRWSVRLLLGWLMLGWMIAYISGSFSPRAVLYAGRFLLYISTTFTFFHWPVSLQKRQFTVSKLKMLYLLAGSLFLLFGLLQYLLLPDTRFLSIMGWDDHYYRLVSTLLDPGFAGIILVLTFIHLTQCSFITNATAWLLKIVLVLGVVLTYSRASYLALVVTFFMLAIKNWRTLKSNAAYLALGGVFCLLVLLAPKPGGEGVNLVRTSTIDSRLSGAVAVAGELSPVQWIVGRGAFMPLQSDDLSASRPYHAQTSDNSVLLLISNLGLVGVGMLLLISWQQRYRLARTEYIAVVALVAVLVHSQFNNTLFEPFVLLFVTGVVLSAYYSRKVTVSS